MLALTFGIGIGLLLAWLGVFAMGSWLESRDRGLSIVERKRRAWRRWHADARLVTRERRERPSRR